MKKLLTLLMLLITIVGITQAQSAVLIKATDKAQVAALSDKIGRDSQMKALLVECNAAEAALFEKVKKNPKYDAVLGYPDGLYPEEEARVAEIKQRMNAWYSTLTSQN
jgi:hypothetical protein